VQQIDPSFSDSPPELIGPYQLVTSIARGATARLYLARHAEKQASFVVKVYAAEIGADVALLQNFQTVAAILSALNHPYVVPILDYGISPKDEPYLVMEYFTGPTLADILRVHSELPISQVMRMLLNTLEGLRAAHDAGLVHGDIKPGNLRVLPNETLQLFDFDLFQPGNGTASPDLRGTALYASPEQNMGQVVDFRSDLYALGATFYHLLAGQPPFGSGSEVDARNAHVNQPLAPIYMLNPRVPSAFAHLIEEMMQKDPERRFASYDVIIENLRELLAARLQKETGGKAAVPQSSVASSQSMGFDGVNSADAHIVESHDYRPAGVSSAVLLKPMGIAIIFAAALGLATFLISPVTTESGTPHARLVVLLNRITGDSVTGDPSPEQLRTQRLQDTVLRIQALRAICLDCVIKEKFFPASVDDLQSRGLATRDQTVDAWGTAMKIVPALEEVHAAGEDGLFNTSDDFVLDSQGRFSKQPAELQEGQARPARH